MLNLRKSKNNVFNLLHLSLNNSKIMHMKKYFIFCIFFAILFSCKQEDLQNDLTENPQENPQDDPQDNPQDDPQDGSQDGSMDTDSFRIWCARPIAYIDDGKVQLIWGPVHTELILRPYEIIEPDTIDIYISENDMLSFKKIIELKNGGSYSYTVDELQNGKQYFFFSVSKKNGFEPLYSDTTMAVPNKKKGFEILQKSAEEYVSNLSNVSIAHKKNKIAYVDNYYYWNGGSNCCMATSVLISNIDGSEKELVKINSYQPSWSPANDKVVFYFDGIHNVGWIPAQIAMYDCKTKSITQLTNDNYNNYSPVFSKNGESILFQSSKNTPGTYETNIWLMNLKTLGTFQVTDISKTSLRTVERPCWIDDDRFLIHGTYSDEKSQYQIFESSVSNGQITKVFDSKWNDYNPSASPDQNKIAFISNRSGINQVWVYFINSKTFLQISGYSNNESVEPGWNSIEWLDNSTIIYTIHGSKLVKQNIE